MNNAIITITCHPAPEAPLADIGIRIQAHHSDPGHLLKFNGIPYRRAINQISNWSAV